MLRDEGYTLTESEAAIFLPCLIEKVVCKPCNMDFDSYIGVVIPYATRSFILNYLYLDYCYIEVVLAGYLNCLILCFFYLLTEKIPLNCTGIFCAAVGT